MVSLLPVIIVSYMAYNNSVEALKEEVTNNLNATVKSKIEYINKYFDE